MRWLYRYDLFISYSHHDRPFVKHLAADLKLRGYEPYYDAGLDAGEPYRGALSKAIRRSLAGLVVVTKNSLASDNVHEEVGCLSKPSWLVKNRVIIPLMLEDPKDLAIPDWLDRRHWLDLSSCRANFASPEYNDKLSALTGRLDRLHQSQRSMSLRSALLVLLSIPLLLAVLSGMTATDKAERALERLRSVQNRIQVQEERLHSLGPTCENEFGEYEFYDPKTRALLAIDQWEKGKRVYRKFYRDGRLVARDEFIYKNGIPTEKIRYYLDEAQTTFLVDHFTQDGVLTKKRVCPQGAESPCELKIVDMRSPLPSLVQPALPVNCLLYR